MQDLLTLKEVRRLFGGSRPLDAATIYRGIHLKRYPAPVKIGSSSRWLRAECEAALAAMMEARHA
jgi:predicted DNA-binding transcriptional regulator AlpA